MFFEEIQVFQHSLSTERLHPTPPWVLIFCLPLPLIVDKMVETMVKKMVQRKSSKKKKGPDMRGPKKSPMVQWFSPDFTHASIYVVSNVTAPR